MSRVKGKIKFFNAQKGFGFIAPDDGQKDVFVHISNIQSGADYLKEESAVEFSLSQGKKGLEATDVKVL